MKTYWSAFLSLLFLMALTGCGNEQFGTGGQSANSTANPLTSFSHQSCSNFTLIKPKVDVVYVVDNSASSFYLASDIKLALQRTVDGLSSDFDYRVVGTPLIETSGGNNDYQVMTNSPDLNGIPTDGRRIQSSNGFTFFANASGGANERGLNRVHSFVNAHRGGLIRTQAYTLIVLVSNGRDVEVEPSLNFNNGEIGYSSTAFNTALSNMRTLKNNLQAQQLRMISVTAQSSCQPGFTPSLRSYVQMSQKLYEDSRATDQSGNATPDAYNICTNSISNIFSTVNSAIKQVIVPHGYRFWPITFAENNETVSLDEIRVTKISPNGSRTELARSSEWTYEQRNPLNPTPTREVPTPGEPISGTHFVRFNNLLMYPDCVLVTSVSRTEYYDWVVLPRRPLLPVTIRVNGQEIPQSALSTSQVNNSQTLNIKADWPNPGSGNDNPPVMRTGFMIQITNPQYFYKSGDSVDTQYTPAGI